MPLGAFFGKSPFLFRQLKIQYMQVQETHLQILNVNSRKALRGGS
jgi:hypothetical protein